MHHGWQAAKCQLARLVRYAGGGPGGGAGRSGVVLMNTKYVIGIDFGTTNSALAYVPLEGDQAPMELLAIPQLVAAGTVESRGLLPSFLVSWPIRTKHGRQRTICPGPRIATLRWVNSPGGKGPKCPIGPWGRPSPGWPTAGVDRHGPILPWQAPAEVPKISPVTASQRYLEHLAAVWNAAFPQAPLAEQTVVLTVPASFDASARELTHEAALAAGLAESMILLEEPQAAAYAWLAAWASAGENCSRWATGCWSAT